MVPIAVCAFLSVFPITFEVPAKHCGAGHVRDDVGLSSSSKFVPWDNPLPK